MAKIEEIRIANYRVLRTSLGKLWNTSTFLTPLSVVIGKNGVGKSSLFDAFGFLADCPDWGSRTLRFERPRRIRADPIPRGRGAD